jgi:hypothetical protein
MAITISRRYESTIATAHIFKHAIAWGDAEGEKLRRFFLINPTQFRFRRQQNTAKNKA